jgi:uncharacterized membrane protein
VRSWSTFILGRVIDGVIILAPIYLAVLLVLKAMGSLRHLVLPLANLFPKWLHATHLLSFLCVLIICFLIGLIVHTTPGQASWNWMENSLLQKIPGYSVFRSLTRQLAGESGGEEWKPALAEIEEALVPAFIIEELPDGRFTVFVPSVPTPFAGTVYILDPARVHLLDVPVTTALKAVSQWGSGCQNLVAAIRKKTDVPTNDFTRGTTAKSA